MDILNLSVIMLQDHLNCGFPLYHPGVLSLILPVLALKSPPHDFPAVFQFARSMKAALSMNMNNVRCASAWFLPVYVRCGYLFWISFLHLLGLQVFLQPFSRGDGLHSGRPGCLTHCIREGEEGRTALSCLKSHTQTCSIKKRESSQILTWWQKVAPDFITFLRFAGMPCKYASDNGGWAFIFLWVIISHLMMGTHS